MLSFELEKSLVIYNVEKNTHEDRAVCTPEPITSCSKGEWVVVLYYNVWYPGQVIQVLDKAVTVKFLSRSERFFSWPALVDIQTVFFTQILCKIDAPYEIKKNCKKVGFRLTDKQFEFVSEWAKNCEIYDI